MSSATVVAGRSRLTPIEARSIWRFPAFGSEANATGSPRSQLSVATTLPLWEFWSIHCDAPTRGLGMASTDEIVAVQRATPITSASNGRRVFDADGSRKGKPSAEIQRARPDIAARLASRSVIDVKKAVQIAVVKKCESRNGIGAVASSDAGTMPALSVRIRWVTANTKCTIVGSISDNSAGPTFLTCP